MSDTYFSPVLSRAACKTVADSLIGAKVWHAIEPKASGVYEVTVKAADAERLDRTIQNAVSRHLASVAQCIVSIALGNCRDNQTAVTDIAEHDLLIIERALTKL